MMTIAETIFFRSPVFLDVSTNGSSTESFLKYTRMNPTCHLISLYWRVRREDRSESIRTEGSDGLGGLDDLRSFRIFYSKDILRKTFVDLNSFK